MKVLICSTLFFLCSSLFFWFKSDRDPSQEPWSLNLCSRVLHKSCTIRQQLGGDDGALCREGTTNGGRHRVGNARKPLTIWHIFHMLTHRFKRLAGRQTQTDAGSVKVKSGLNNSDKGWICWKTAAYYMTALCSAGCFYCYYKGNDTQWRVQLLMASSSSSKSESPQWR